MNTAVLVNKPVPYLDTWQYKQHISGQCEEGQERLELYRQLIDENTIARFQDEEIKNIF